MKKLISTNSLILLASTLLSLLIAEIFLRAFLPEDMSTTWSLRVPHPEYGWSLQEGVSYHYRMATDLIYVEHNSRGFHDDEHSYEKVTGVPRIVVLGDSFMEAFSVSDEDTFHKQLAGRLHKAGRPVEVINLGVGGYGTLQEYLVYMAEGRHYQPDVVLLGFYFANDLRNNDRELETIVTGGTIKSTSRPFLEEGSADEFSVTAIDYAGAMQRYAAATQAKDTLLHRLAEHIAIFRALELASARLFPARGQSSADEQEQRDFVAFGMHFCEEPAAFTRAWRTTGRILERLNREVIASGAELIVFTVTAEYEVTPELMHSLAKGNKDPGALCLEWAPAYQRLREISEELGVTYVDLLAEFRQGASTGTGYFLADRHWNAAGHALAARQVGEVLLTRSSLGR